MKASNPGDSATYSDQISYIPRGNISSLPLPTLNTYMRFLCVLSQMEEDVIMHKIRLEQMVDSMDLSSAWYQRLLAGWSTCHIVKELIDNKHLRVDEFVGREIYRMNKESTSQIPGYSE